MNILLRELKAGNKIQIGLAASISLSTDLLGEKPSLMARMEGSGIMCPLDLQPTIKGLKSVLDWIDTEATQQSIVEPSDSSDPQTESDQACHAVLSKRYRQHLELPENSDLAALARQDAIFQPRINETFQVIQHGDQNGLGVCLVRFADDSEAWIRTTDFTFIQGSLQNLPRHEATPEVRRFSRAA